MKRAIFLILLITIPASILAQTFDPAAVESPGTLILQEKNIRDHLYTNEARVTGLYRNNPRVLMNNALVAVVANGNGTDYRVLDGRPGNIGKKEVRVTVMAVRADKNTFQVSGGAPLGQWQRDTTVTIPPPTETVLLQVARGKRNEQVPCRLPGKGESIVVVAVDSATLACSAPFVAQ